MRRVFHEELARLGHMVVDISEMVKEAITRATEAFGASNVALAEKVIAADHDIDKKCNDLDELAIEILGLQQPVARELRLTLSSLRIGNSLERMGDLAEHIALLTRYRFPNQVVPPLLEEPFRRMGEIDVLMATLLVQLLKDPNDELLMTIRDLDDELDEIHASVFERLLADQFDGEVISVVDSILASRYHERFGDHVVSITKRVHYLLSGNTENKTQEN